MYMKIYDMLSLLSLKENMDNISILVFIKKNNNNKRNYKTSFIEKKEFFNIVFQ